MNNKIESAIKSIKYESIRYDEAIIRLNKMLNSKNSEISKLQQQLKEAEKVIETIISTDFDLDDLKTAREYLKKYRGEK